MSCYVIACYAQIHAVALGSARLGYSVYVTQRYVLLCSVVLHHVRICPVTICQPPKPHC